MRVRPDANLEWCGNGPRASSLHNLSRLHLQEGIFKNGRHLMYYLSIVHWMYLEHCTHINSATKKHSTFLAFLNFFENALFNFWNIICFSLEHSTQCQFSILIGNRSCSLANLSCLNFSWTFLNGMLLI